ncbi:MAG: hypothetical protein U0271_13315 [Polyangiaceae bacterium]
MRIFSLGLVGAVLVFGAGLAACGDDDGTGGSGASTNGGAGGLGAGGGAGGGGAAATGGAGGSGGLGGGSAADFAAVETQVFSGCQGGGPMSCHGSSPFDGELDLRPGHAYQALVGIAAHESPGKTRVIPGDVANSFLTQKLTNDLAGDGSEGVPMPSGEAIMWMQIPDDKLSLVTTWIAAGAPQ